jgi:hypothetical protein
MIAIRAILVILVSTAVALRAQEAIPAPTPRSDAWTVRQPYSNNPLRQAMVVGSLSIDGEIHPAQLQIECRAPELARFNLLFAPTSLKFNVDPFEGPPGIGQKRKLLVMQLAGEVPKPHFFNGFYVESDRFVFAVAPTRTEASRILSADFAGKQLKVQVSPANGKGNPLLFTFTLPTDNTPAHEVAKPCLVVTEKAAEPKTP